MDQVKIGRFIAECRKRENLTQMQLAEKLNITDRAVSKWERGKAMPDSSIMLDLCKILKITVNDLLSGEILSMENYNKELENNLLEMVKQKEKADRRLLSLEVVIGITSFAVFFAMLMIASFATMDDWVRILIISISAAAFLAICFTLIRIEQVAGYYECKVCGHRYVPTFKAVSFSAHMGRTRYMKCPKCQKKSWQKKVISREKEEK